MNPEHLRWRCRILLQQTENRDNAYAYQLAEHCIVILRTGNENNYTTWEQAQKAFPNLIRVTEP